MNNSIHITIATHYQTILAQLNETAGVVKVIDHVQMKSAEAPLTPQQLAASLALFLTGEDLAEDLRGVLYHLSEPLQSKLQDQGSGFTFVP